MTSEMILFLDIETCPEFDTFNDLPADGQLAFLKKFTAAIERGEYATPAEAYEKNAALLAEFSKVICVGVARISNYSPAGPSEMLNVGTLTGDEETILSNLSKMISKNPPDFLCAHNGKRFDFPFLSRRYTIKGTPMPRILDNRFKKPWETSLLDTAEMWKFADTSYYVSLATLAYCLGFKSPKEIMTGAEVPKAFKEGMIEKIADYCIDDVVTLVNCYRKMMFETPFETNNIKISKK